MSDVASPGRLGRVARTAAAGALACVSLAACASVPMTGPVVPGEGGDSSGDPYGGYVRLLPAGPQPGVEPEGLINGFLKDLGSFEEDHKAARSYMLPEMGEEWSPDGAVQVFSDLDAVDLDSEISTDGRSATVRIRSNEVASIDENGKYVPAETGTMLEETFELAREGDTPEGEWRIQDLPDEIILSQLDVERTYRPFNLYYFNPEGTALVPDPVYLPVSTDQLADRLLRKLIEGPTDWLAPAVLSAFPEEVAPRTEVDAERAVISINGAPEADEYSMGAQIAWTLRQLPEIQEFTLRINGEEVGFPKSDGDSSDRPRPGSDYWARVSPGATSSGINAYFTHEGQLWSAADWEADTFADAERVPGPLGAGDIPLDRFAVSLDESTIAGITLGGGEVVTSFASPGAEAQEVLGDGMFTELSWDVNGNLWVVEETRDDARSDDEDDDEDEDVPADDEPDADGSGGQDPPAPGDTALWLLRDGDEVAQAEIRGLRDHSLVHFRISRDGARAAVVTEQDGERSLKVGRVVEGEDGQVSVGAFISLADQELEDVTGVSWRSSDQLVVLGSRDGGTTQALFVSLDGGTPAASAGAPVAGMITISGAPGQPLLAGSDDGNIWVSNDPLNWRNVVEGGSPTFPG